MGERLRLQKKPAPMTIVVLSLICGGAGVCAEVSNQTLTGQGASVEYNIKKDASRGTFRSAIGPFKLTYKQGERDSNNPVQVARAFVAAEQPYHGSSSIGLEILPNRERNPRSTAFYKVALSSIDSRTKLLISLNKEFVHNFAMRIGDKDFDVVAGQQTIVEQFWQGSPFHPPISLQVIDADFARSNNWTDTGTRGNFALVLSDDAHGPLDTLPGKPLLYDLGAITFDKWIDWSIMVCPSPSKPTGSLVVTRNGQIALKLKNINIGYNPENPQYTNRRPADQFSSVEVMLYRKNGLAHQRILFNDISLKTLDKCQI